jgi:hypothetical protein
MTGEKHEPTNAPSAERELDETELIQDLEIEDADEAEALRGGSSGAGAGKITFNPFSPN